MSNIGYVNGNDQVKRREEEAEAHRGGRGKHYDVISKIAQRKFEERREIGKALDDACEEFERTLEAIERHKNVY